MISKSKMMLVSYIGKILLGILFLLVYITSSAQGTHEPFVVLKGLVVNELENRPVRGATVTVKDDKGRLLYTGPTSDNGIFNIQVVAKNSVELQVRHLGMQAYETTVKTLGGDNIDVGTIYLVQGGELINEVEVTATMRKRLIVGSRDKITYNAEADISNKSGTAADVLRKTPMLTVDPSGQLKMRGNSNIKVLLNGAATSILAKNLKEALKMIPASSIVAVEVITNPAAKYEAEGAAGVVNIITKKRLSGHSTAIDLGVGNLEQRSNANFDKSNGKFRFVATGSFMREKEKSYMESIRRSFKGPVENTTLYQSRDELSHSKGGYLSLMGQYEIDSLQTIETNLSLWKEISPQKSTLNNRYGGAQHQSYRQESEQKGEFGFYDIVMNYQKKFKTEGQELQLVGQTSRSTKFSEHVTDQYTPEGSRVFREANPSRGHDRDWSLQADYVHPFSFLGKLTLETGMRIMGTSSLSSYDVTNSDFPIDPSRSGKIDYAQRVFAAYASLDVETVGDWKIRPGIRFERTGIDATFRQGFIPLNMQFSNWVPGILISKELSESHELKWNYSERIRRPFIWDLNPYVDASDPLNTIQGNPELRPEKIRVFEVGHNYNHMQMSLLTNIYYNINQNSVESLTKVNASGKSHTTLKNIGANRRLGMNINANFSPIGKWTVNFGGDLFCQKFSSKALEMENKGVFYNISMSQTYQVSNSLTVSASGEYSNGKLFLQGNTSAVYAYTMSIRKQIMKDKAAITLTASNPFQQNLMERRFTRDLTFNEELATRFYNRSATLTFSWKIGGTTRTEEKQSWFSGHEMERGSRKSRK